MDLSKALKKLKKVDALIKKLDSRVSSKPSTITFELDLSEVDIFKLGIDSSHETSGTPTDIAKNINEIIVVNLPKCFKISKVDVKPVYSILLNANKTYKGKFLIITK